MIARASSLRNEPPAPTLARHAASILIVDDDDCIRERNSLVLASAGYHTGTAADGWEGWHAVHANHYDLVITDNQMPRLSGLEFVRKLRSECLLLPVVLACGSLEAAELERHADLAFAATLPKPYDMQQLLATVQRVLLNPPPDVMRRIQQANPFLSDAAAHCAAYPRWGINE